MMSTLQKKYKEEIIAKMKEKFNFKNELEVPRLQKIVINMGDTSKKEIITEKVNAALRDKLNHHKQTVASMIEYQSKFAAMKKERDRLSFDKHQLEQKTKNLLNAVEKKRVSGYENK